jgi:hypothetical protein
MSREVAATSRLVAGELPLLALHRHVPEWSLADLLVAAGHVGHPVRAAFLHLCACATCGPRVGAELCARGAVLVAQARGREVALQAGLDLGYAQGWAEDHARRLGASTLIDRGAEWRQAPASEKQIDTLRRCRVPVPPGLTKGEAADLLTATFARSRRW